MNLNKVRPLVEEWARQVGEIQLRYFRSADLEIATKYNDFDVVTRADKESEALIISKINETFPDHDILAEESGEYSRQSNFVRIRVWQFLLIRGNKEVSTLF